MEDIIQISDLKKYYNDKRVIALNGVDLRIKKGEFVSIIGPSGSGKSTLLNLIGSLDLANEGEIKVNGVDLRYGTEFSDFRSNIIGFIFQEPLLIPNFTALENIMVPMCWNGKNEKEMFEIAFNLLKYLDLDKKSNDLVKYFSGGEKQRVVIARSLVNNPKIILADEPTGSLDSKNAKEIINLLIKIHKEKEVTLVLVSHDMEIAAMADRIIKIKDGKIV